MAVTNGIRHQSDADRQALIESMASVYGISVAEAAQRYENGNWEGFNSTQVAAENEAEAVAFGGTATLSIPNEEWDEDENGRRTPNKDAYDTVPQQGVALGVTPAAIVKGDEDEEGREQMSEERRQVISPTNRRSFVETDEHDPDKGGKDESASKKAPAGSKDKPADK